MIKLHSFFILLFILTLCQKNYASINICENIFASKYISINKQNYFVSPDAQLFEFRFGDFKDFIQIADRLVNSDSRVIGFKRENNKNTMALMLLTAQDARRLTRELEIDGIVVEYYTVPEKLYSELDLNGIETFDAQKTPSIVHETLPTAKLASEQIVTTPPVTEAGPIKKILYSFTFRTGSSDYLMQAFQQRGMKVISVQVVGDSLIITAESYPFELASFVSQQIGFRGGRPLGNR